MTVHHKVFECLQFNVLSIDVVCITNCFYDYDMIINTSMLHNDFVHVECVCGSTFADKLAVT